MYQCKCGCYISDNVPICPRCGTKIFGPNDPRPNNARNAGGKCPDCGMESVIYQEGCAYCQCCGWSKCG